MLLSALFLIAGGVFGGMALRTLYYLPLAQRLPASSSVPSKKKRVSVVLAARDEETRVEETIRRLLAQRDVELEIICVDDRSKDSTGQILKRLSTEDPRVCPKRVDHLPEGWLGKCYACSVGTASASGEWILFTDADCWLKPDTLVRALEVAERELVQHITLTPGVSPHTVPAQGWHIAFLITITDWIARVNRDKPGCHLGIGAFNLVRTETYRAFGGHDPLRMTVVDDIKLGKLVRSVGGRTRAFIGGDDVECHWGVRAREMIGIMEKNYYAALDYKTGRAFLVGTAFPVLWLLCVLGPVTLGGPGVFAAMGLLMNILPGIVLTKRLGWKMDGALATPLIFPLLFYAVLNSTVVTLRQGGIRWRDTFYSLEELRAGNLK